MLGGVRQDLDSIESEDPEADQPHLPRDAEDLYEHVLEVAEVLAPEGGDGVVVGVLVRREHPECDILVGGPLDASR